MLQLSILRVAKVFSILIHDCVTKIIKRKCNCRNIPRIRETASRLNQVIPVTHTRIAGIISIIRYSCIVRTQNHSRLGGGGGGGGTAPSMVPYNIQRAVSRQTGGWYILHVRSLLQGTQRAALLRACRSVNAVLVGVLLMDGCTVGSHLAYTGYSSFTAVELHQREGKQKKKKC